MSENTYRILVVDDDLSVREMLDFALASFGEVDLAGNGKQARQLFHDHEYDIVLMDYLMPDIDGLKLLVEFKELQPRTEIVMITHVREIKLAVQSIKAGAFDYINKDFDIDDLNALILRVIEKIKSNREVFYLRSEVERLTEHEFIMGDSATMKSIEEVMARAATTTATVLIQGESGTGKELVARYLHRHSPRVQKPFVVVNMASIPDNLIESTLFGHEKGSFTGAVKTNYGKFELADAGTIFCDEIAELKLELQSKLLRVMQENEIERIGGSKPIHVDVRIIAATNRDLKSLVQEGKFREDLFYRLNVIPINLPPLRHRIEDINLFIELFLRRYNRKYGRTLSISREASIILSQYDWPGNIRELENLVARLVAIHPSDTILPEDIPIDYHFSDPLQLKEGGEVADPLKNATDAFERGFILRVLEKERWHQENTAAKLGIHRKTLEYKIKKLNLSPIIQTRQREQKNH